MNSTLSFPRQLGRISLLVAVAVGVVFAAHLVASWLAPIVAIPLLVGSWVVGLGLAILLPFAIVATVAGVVSR